MNRPIKFRAWDKNNEEFFPSYKILINEDGQPFYKGNNATEVERLDESRVDIQLFTGLLDKNGKEIYEGDILRFFNPQKPHKVYTPQEVFWLEDKMTWRLRSKDGHLSGIASENGLLHKVIGNIYENSKLVN